MHTTPQSPGPPQDCIEAVPPPPGWRWTLSTVAGGIQAAGGLSGLGGLIASALPVLQPILTQGPGLSPWWGLVPLGADLLTWPLRWSHPARDPGPSRGAGWARVAPGAGVLVGLGAGCLVLALVGIGLLSVGAPAGMGPALRNLRSQTLDWTAINAFWLAGTVQTRWRVTHRRGGITPPAAG